jgi:hypothetical protein
VAEQANAKKYVNLQIKFRINKNLSREDTSGMLQLFKQRFIDATSPRLSKSFHSPSILLKRNNYVASVFPNRFDLGIYETKFPTHISFIFFLFYICCVALTFPSMLKTFLLFLTIAMLSLYQSPVICRSRDVEGNLMYTVIYR